MILSFFAHVTAALSVFPLLSFIIIYMVTFFFSKSKATALQWAIISTTILLFISIPLTVEQLWGFSIRWLLIVICLLFFAAILTLQWATKGQFLYLRALHSLVRLSFLLFLPIHLLLYLWVFLRALWQSFV